MDVDVRAFLDGLGDLSDIFAVFDGGVAGRQIGEGDFVSERCVFGGAERKFGVVFGVDAEHVLSGGEVFHDDDADVVFFVVDEQVRNVLGHGAKCSIFLGILRRLAEKSAKKTDFSAFWAFWAEKSGKVADLTTNGGRRKKAAKNPRFRFFWRIMDSLFFYGENPMNFTKTARIVFAAMLAVSPFAPPAAARHCTLCEPAKAGDVDKLRELLDKGAEIDASHWGRGALYEAMLYGKTNAAMFLLDRGANPNKRQAGTNNQTPFYISATHAPFVLKKMLAKGGDVHDNRAGPILYHPVRRTQTENVKILLKAGAKIDESVIEMAEKGVRGKWPNAAREVVKLLQKSPDGGLFLKYFIAKNHLDGIKGALRNGTNVNYKDGGGKTALMHAAEKKDDKFVKALLEKNAEIDLQDKEGKTALMHAAKAGRTKTAKALLEADANTELEDRRGKTVWDIIGNRFLMRALFRKVLLAKHDLDVGEGGNQ